VTVGDLCVRDGLPHIEIVINMPDRSAMLRSGHFYFSARFFADAVVRSSSRALWVQVCDVPTESALEQELGDGHVVPP
jgi:hypothetical protein